MTLLMLFKVSGHSMEPTFKAGQILLVSSVPYLFKEPRAGDVVVVRDPRDRKPLLKRIVEIRPRRSIALGPTRSKYKEYFVSGDNRGHSRTFGPVSKEQIVGKVI